MPPLLADFIHLGVYKPICAKSLTLPFLEMRIILPMWIVLNNPELASL